MFGNFASFGRSQELLFRCVYSSLEAKEGSVFILPCIMDILLYLSTGKINNQNRVNILFH